MAGLDIELIGYIGAGLIAVSLVPQVLRSWKTKSTKDISIQWTLIYLTGLIIWIGYGFGISSMPLILMTSVEAALTASLLYLKLRYG